MLYFLLHLNATSIIFDVEFIRNIKNLNMKYLIVIRDANNVVVSFIHTFQSEISNVEKLSVIHRDKVTGNGILETERLATYSRPFRSYFGQVI